MYFGYRWSFRTYQSIWVRWSSRYSTICLFSLGFCWHYWSSNILWEYNMAYHTRLFDRYNCGYSLILTRQHCKKSKKLKIFHINVCQLGFYSNLKTMAKIFFCQVWLFNWSGDLTIVYPNGLQYTLYIVSCFWVWYQFNPY